MAAPFAVRTRRGGEATPLLPVAATTVAAIGTAYLVAGPHQRLGIAALLAVGALAATLVLPAPAFCAACLVVFGASQVAEARPILTAGGFHVYAGDVLLVLVLVRAALPRERRPPRGLEQQSLFLRVALSCWALVMLAGVVRGIASGSPIANAIRLALPLIYFPLYFVGFSAVVRERHASIDRIVVRSALVAVGFVVWMFAMQATGHRFETATGETGRLGEVVIRSGAVLHRDYGFASAFIIYPLLALGAVAYLARGGDRRGRAMAIAALGVAATVVTLIRAETFGLLAGIAAVLLASSPRATKAIGHRSRTIAALLAVAVVIGVTLFAVAPATGRGIAERALPGVFAQSSAASENAAFREHALGTGLRFARAQPTGLGFVAPASLANHAIDPSYLAHSAPALLLVYVGWPGLVATLGVLLALVLASFRTVARPTWLHPFFVGAMALSAVYGFGASGLVGQSWVMGITAYVIALRFAVPLPDPDGT